MGINGSRVVVVALFFAGAAPVSQAQVTTAEIQGRVQDASGAAIPGAAVTARNTDTAIERSARSDARGNYRLPALAAGRYQITAALAGFVTSVRTGVTLRIGQEAGLDFRLEVSPREETVTVEGDAPIVEATRSALGSTFTTRQIDELAVADRSFANLVFLTPGILDGSGPSSDQTTVTVTASGGNGANNTFLIDGLSNDADSLSDTRGQFALDAVAEFQVISSQFDAEFGQASGAIVNALTRSGTNQLRGRAYGYYRADELSANDPYVQPDSVTGEKEKAPFSQKIFGLTLGGPLRKDKTFFFLSYDHTFRDASTVVSVDPGILSSLGLDTQGTYENPVRNPLVLAKLDHHPSDTQTLSLRYRLDRRTEENQTGGGNFASDSFFNTLAKNYDFALSHTWTASPRVVNDARFQFARQVNDLQPTCDGCPILLRPSVISGKLPNQPQTFTEDRLQFLDTLSFAVPDKGGDHYFKAGVDFSVLSISGAVPQNFDGLFIFNTDSPFNAADPDTYPFIYQESSGDPNFDIDNNLYAFFLQDQWRVSPRLTLNLGLRWDYEDHVAVKGDKNNFAPRLHFAWDPSGKGKTSVRGGFGIYYDQVFLNVPLLGVLLGGTIETTTLLLPGYPDPRVGGPGIPIPNPPPTVYRFQDGGLDTPSNRTLSIGVKHELHRDLAVSVDLVHARGRNLLLLIDENYSINGSRASRPELQPGPDDREPRALELQGAAGGHREALFRQVLAGACLHARRHQAQHRRPPVPAGGQPPHRGRVRPGQQRCAPHVRRQRQPRPAARLQVRRLGALLLRSAVQYDHGRGRQPGRGRERPARRCRKELAPRRLQLGARHAACQGVSGRSRFPGGGGRGVQPLQPSKPRLLRGQHGVAELRQPGADPAGLPPAPGAARRARQLLANQGAQCPGIGWCRS